MRLPAQSNKATRLRTTDPTGISIVSLELASMWLLFGA
jgi:hypothetical protein